MNRIFKLKFQRQTSQLVVVSELATQAGKATATTVATPDTATSKTAALRKLITSQSLLAATALVTLGGYSVGASALTNPQVMSGSVSIEKLNDTTRITNTPNAIIGWESFNIQANEVVEFIQQNKDSAVLNRVLGGDVSTILGTLKSNGNVFLINPNGIVFGKAAVVDTAGLVASTLNLTDADFKAHNYVFSQEKDHAIAQILNQGLITVKADGSLALIGGQVANSGVLRAENGNLYLVAGQEIQIADLKNPLVSFKVTADNAAVNLGELVGNNISVVANKVSHGTTGYSDLGNLFTNLYSQANSGSATKVAITGNGVQLYAGSVADSLQTTSQANSQVAGERNGYVVLNGTIDVSNKAGQAGSVVALGNYLSVENNSRILATGETGGKVNLGGDLKGTGTSKLAKVTVLGDQQLIDVSATNDAGTAIVWGDVATVNGSFLAQSQQGRGGFVETSAKGLNVENGIYVSTKSDLGKEFTGKWLLDPKKLVVTTVQEGAILGQSSGGDKTVFGDKNEGPEVSNVTNASIEAALETTDVELQATENVALANVIINKTAHGLTINTKDYEQNNSTIVVKTFDLTATGNVSMIGNGSKPGENAPYMINVNETLNINAVNFSMTQNASMHSENAAIVINADKVTFDKAVIDTKGNACATFNGKQFEKVEGVQFISTGGSITLNSTGEGNDLVLSCGTTATIQMGGKGDINLFSKGNVTYKGASDDGTSAGGLATITGIVNITASKSVEINSSRVIGFNGVKVNAGEDINVSSTVTGSRGASFMTRTGGVEFTAGRKADIGSVPITSGGDVTVTAQSIGDINTTICATSGNVTLNAQTGDINFTSTAKVNSTKGNVTVTTKSGDVNTQTGTELAATKELTVSATDVNLTGATLKGPEAIKVEATEGNATVSGTSLSSGSINVTAAKNATLAVDTVTSTTGDIVVNAKDGLANVTGALTAEQNINISGKTVSDINNSLTSNSGSINVSAASGDVNVAANAKINATKGDVSVVAKSGNVNASTGSEFNAKDNLTITGTKVNLDSNAITGNKTININATAGTADVKATTLTGGDVKVDATDNATVNVTTLTANANDTSGAQGNVSIKSSTGSAEVTGALTANSSVDVSGKTGATVNAAITSNQGDVNVSAETGNINVTENGKVNATAGDVSVVAKAGSVNAAAGSTFNAKDDLTITGQSVNLTSDAVTGNKTINITATAGTADVKAAKVAGGDVIVNATVDVNVTVTELNATENSTSGAQGNVTIKSASGTTNVTGTPINADNNVAISGNQLTDINTAITSKNGGVNLTAETGNVNLTDTANLTGKGDVTVNAKTGDVNATSEVVLSSEKNLTVAGQNVNVTAKSVQGNSSVNITASTGNATVNTTSLTGGDVKVDAAKNADVNVTTLAANADYTSGNLGNVSIKASSGNATVVGGVTAANDATISGSGNTSVNATVTATAGDVVINSTAGNIDLGTKAKINATAGDVSITTPTGNVTSQPGSEFNAKDNLTISGTNVTLDATAVTGEKVVNITATGENGAASVKADKVAGGDITVDAKGDVNVTVNNLTATAKEDNSVLGNVTIKSATGTTNVTGTPITAGNDVTISGNKLTDINTTITSAKGDVTLDAKTGDITLNATANITAKEGDVSVTTKDGNVNSTAGSVLSAKEDLTVSGSNVSLDSKTLTGEKSVNITATGDKGTTSVKAENVTGGDVTVDAKGDVNVTVNNLTANASEDNGAQGNVTIKSANGTTNVTGTPISAANDVTISGDKVAEINTTITSSKGDVAITANQGDVVLSEKANVSATGTGGDVTISTKDGNVTSKDGAVLAADKDLTVSGNNVTLANTSLQGNNSITINATNGTASVDKGAVAGGDITVTGKDGAKLTNATVTANANTTSGNQGNVTVNSDNGVAAVTGSPITADNNVSLTGNTVAPINTTITSNNGDVDVTAKTGDVKVDSNAAITSSNGNVTIDAQSGNVSLADGTSLTAKKTVDVSGTNVTAVNATLKGEDAVNINATLGDANITKGSLTGGNVDVEATNNATVAGASVTGNQGLSTDPQLPGDVTIKAKNGTANVTGTPITANNDVNISGKTVADINTSITAKNGNIDIAAKEGNVNLTAGANVNSSEGNVTITTDNGDVNLAKDVALTAKKEVDITASNVTATGATLKGSDAVNINATTGSAKLDKVTVTGGNVDVEAAKDAQVTGSTVTGNQNTDGSKAGDVTIKAKDGQANVTGTPITANNDVNITGKTVADVNTSITAANGDVTIGAQEGNVNLTAGAKVDSSKGNVTITTDKGDVNLAQDVALTAKKELEITASNVTANGATLKGSDAVNINATTGSAKLDKVTVAGGNVDVEAAKDAQVTNSSVTGNQSEDSTKAGDVTIKANDGKASLTGTPITANNNVTVSGKTVADLNTSISSANGDVTVSAQEGDVKLTDGANVTAKDGDVTITAKDGNVSAAAGTVLDAAKDLNVAANDITLANTSVTGKENVNLTASKGNVTLNGGSLTTGGDVTVTAENNANLDNVTINTTATADNAGDVTVNAKTGTTTVTGTDINATGNISITGNKDVVLADSNITANPNKDVNITANTGDIKGTNTTLGGENITLSAKEGTLDSDKLTTKTGDTLTVLAGKDVEFNDNSDYGAQNLVVKVTNGKVILNGLDTSKYESYSFEPDPKASFSNSLMDEVLYSPRSKYALKKGDALEAELENENLRPEALALAQAQETVVTNKAPTSKMSFTVGSDKKVAIQTCSTTDAVATIYDRYKVTPKDRSRPFMEVATMYKFTQTDIREAMNSCGHIPASFILNPAN